MLRKKNTKTKTVSEKITELVARNVNGEEDSSDEQGEEPRVEEEFDEYDLPDARTSDIRKRNVKLLSEQSARYRGKISSRNELEEKQDSDTSEDEEQEDEDSTGDEDDDGVLKAFTNKLSGAASQAANARDEDGSEDDLAQSSQLNSGSEDEDDEEEERNVEDDDDEDDEEEGDVEDDDDEDDDGIESEDDASEEEIADGTDIIAETNRQAEVQKGQCVQSQLQIWERLLEMRINTQKILSKSNQLPAPSELKALQKQNEKLTNVSRESVARVSNLLSTLLQLQKACSQQFSEQRNALKSSLKRSVPIQNVENDSPVPLKRFADHIHAHFQEFKPYRNAVLLKWDDRTKLLTPGAGVKKKSLTEDYDIIKKIENTLQSRTTLIEKSRTLKNGVDDNTLDDGQEAGDAVNTEKQSRNAELYDDSDFYHQQLRELIEYKTNTSVSAGELTQQYMELQKLRQKMKKKVDTRASKGRKLRYTVHNKLINFMAPDDTSTWTEESKDELYRSLFAA